MPKKINPELRARALRMVQEHQQDDPSQTAVAQAVAKQLGLGRETVRRWIVQADIDAGERPGVTSAEHAGNQVTARVRIRELSAGVCHLFLRQQVGNRIVMRFEDLLDRLVWRVVATNPPDIVINCRRVTLATPADIADRC
jgi:transposase-like protein